MAWSTTKGFCFRMTSGYVTNPTNTTHVIGTQNGGYTNGEAYPTTRSIGGENVTFGWSADDAAINCRDGSTSSPNELAGINYLGSDGTFYFRVDVPASGDYKVQLAIGDRRGEASTANLIVKDGIGGSALLTIQDSNLTYGKFYDAAGTNHNNAATWDSSGRVWSGVLTLTGTVMCFYITRDATYTQPGIAFINIEQQPASGGSGAGAYYVLRNQ